MSTSDAIELAMVILTALSVVGSCFYTIFSSYQNNKRDKQLKFQTKRNALKQTINAYYAVYQNTSKFEMSSLLLTETINAIKNLNSTTKKNINDEELVNDINTFEKLWMQFYSYLLKNHLPFNKLDPQAKLFIHTSISYIETLDSEDYETSSLLTTMSDELNSFTK